jgi:hypothetical protein
MVALLILLDNIICRVVFTELSVIAFSGMSFIAKCYKCQNPTSLSFWLTWIRWAITMVRCPSSLSSVSGARFVTVGAMAET